MPSQPGQVDTTTSSLGVPTTLRFTPSPGCVTYKFVVTQRGNPTDTFSQQDLTNAEVTFNQLKPYKVYDYEITAINGIGNQSIIISSGYFQTEAAGEIL